jgi:hypothetical protein
MDKLLGMYIHMHRGCRRPYSARTWMLADWRNYANGLKALGYNLVIASCRSPKHGVCFAAIAPQLADGLLFIISESS